MGEQPSRRLIEKDARPFGSRPAQSVQPAGQTKSRARVDEIAIPVTRADLSRMRPARPAVAVELETTGVREVQLYRQA